MMCLGCLVVLAVWLSGCLIVTVITAVLRTQRLIHGEAEVKKMRDEAKRLREEGKEKERRKLLAQHRDKVRRRMIADGVPLPENLKEQEWERQIARGEVCAR